MTIRPDDMVFRPSIGEQRVPSARSRAREKFRIAREQKQGGLRRFSQAVAQRRLARVREQRAGSARRARTARAARTRTLAGRAGSRALLNPVGAAIAALVVVAGVATRLASGRSFENLGQNVNEILFGDLDDSARATASVREQLASDPQLSRIAAQAGGPTDQMRTLARELVKIRTRQEAGRSRFLTDPEFQSDSSVDLLILRARDKLVSFWAGIGGDDKLNTASDRLGDLYTSRTGDAK